MGAADGAIGDLLGRDDSLPPLREARSLDGRGVGTEVRAYDADSQPETLPDLSQGSFNRLWGSLTPSEVPTGPTYAGQATAVAVSVPADDSGTVADDDEDDDDQAPTGLTIALVVGAIGLAISAGWTIMTGEATTTGVLSVLPIEGFFAPLLASLAFGLVLSRTPISTRLAAFSLFGLFATVELMPALGILRAGSPLSWLQVSLIDQRSGGTIPMFSAVSGGFPGAAALYRTLSGSLGLSSSAALNVLAPVLTHAAMLIPTWWIARRLSQRGRWIAMWFVTIFGGAAQDRLGSAPLACLLFVGLAAALWEEQHEGIAFERSELFWAVGMVGLVLVSLPAQTVMLATLVICSLLRRDASRERKLAVIAGVVTALGWAGWFVLGHGTATTPLMSTLRLVDAARDESALGIMPRTWVQAIPPAAGFIVAAAAIALAVRGLLRASKADLVVVAGAAAAGALVVPGNWGLRLVAMSAPFLGVLAATSTDDNPDHADRHERSALTYALAGTVLVLTTLFARFGDVAFTSIQVADVDSVEFIAASTPVDAQVLTTTAAVPWNPQRMGRRTLIRVGSPDSIIDVSAINRAAKAAKNDRPILLFLSVSGAKRADAQRGVTESSDDPTSIPTATATSAAENKILAEELVVSGDWTQLRSELGSVILQHL